MLGFDFSRSSIEKRREILNQPVHIFSILKSEFGHIEWKLGSLTQHLDWSGFHILFQHLLLKMILNIHSTLIMGRLGRYQNNLMTWVRPTNGKLIDRACRYVIYLLEEDGVHVSYDEVVKELFHQSENIGGTESIVLKTYEALR